MKIEVNIDSLILGIQRRKEMENELRKFHRDTNIADQSSNQFSGIRFYKVISGSYKDKYVKLLGKKNYYECMQSPNKIDFKWFTYLVYLLPNGPIQEVVPWSLQLMPPRNCAKLRQ